MSTTTSSSSLTETDYMTLLVTELQNQNPLEPMDNYQMASEMTQFTQLSEVQDIGDSFDSVLSLVKSSYASSLIGKEITYQTTADDGTTGTGSGAVTGVTTDDSDGVVLKVGDTSVSLSDVQSIGS